MTKQEDEDFYIDKDGNYQPRVDFEDNEFPFDEEDLEDDYPMDAQERVAVMESDLEDISFETNSQRTEFCNKYEKALREAGYEEDDITDKIEDIQNGTMTREDLCDYYGCDDDELDDAMESDMRDYD